MKLHSILAGTLLLRSYPGGSTAIVGLVHLPMDAELKADACHLLSFADGTAELTAQTVPVTFSSELEGQGIDAALRAECWPVVRDPRFVCVRLIEAFPESNGWVVYGVSRGRIDAGANVDEAGHAWVDISTGSITQVHAPADPVGSTMSQMLTNHPIWPDLAGIPHRLPQHPTRWRSRYFLMSQILARCGAGEISWEVALSQLKSDPLLDRIRPYSPEPDYLRYLAALREENLLIEDAPISGEDWRARNSSITRLLCAAQETA